MSAFDSLTDASGRSLADHADRLQRTLDGLAARVRDAIAIAVGAAVDGAVQAAVRVALADIAGVGPAVAEGPDPRPRPAVLLGRPERRLERRAGRRPVRARTGADRLERPSRQRHGGSPLPRVGGPRAGRGPFAGGLAAPAPKGPEASSMLAGLTVAFHYLKIGPWPPGRRGQSHPPR